MTNAVLSTDGKSLTVHLSLTFRKAGRRKRIVVPEGAPAWQPEPAAVNKALLTAISRAHRWKNMMESGEFASLGDLAKSENINFSYVCRILRLTLLSPKTAEAILNGRQRPTLELRELLKPLPCQWQEQEAILD